mmetsp:Transcript_7959/g.16012  ORF Transcript_7959/g.16012 Transcript_7959/m.16012 type:complete len:1543 (-) Transcript_7959:52-4680(-)
MSKPNANPPPPQSSSSALHHTQSKPPHPPSIDVRSNSRSLSRGDSLLWERGSADDSPRSPCSPERAPQLKTSVSVSHAEDRFRTSTLLNGTGTQHFSSSPMSASYISNEGFSPIGDSTKLSRTASDDFGVSPTSLLSKAFTIRQEDIISNSPTRATLGAVMNNSHFFPEKASANSRIRSSSREDNTDELCAMSKFSSTLILEHVRHIGDNSDASVQCDEFEGAAMIVDVSGFTKMCEEFSKGGGGTHQSVKKSDTEDGTHTTAATFATTLYRFNNEQELEGSGGEKVREVLETIMGGIIHVVDEHGGDVLRVAGDAVIAVFHAGKKKHVMEAELVDCCCRCAFECIELMKSPSTIKKVGRQMVLHIGISSGTLDSYHVGSAKGDFQNVVTGPAFDDVGQALVLAGAGEVVVHRRTSSLLKASNWTLMEVPNNDEYDSHQYRRIKITESKAESLIRKSLSSLEYIPPPLERQSELDVWLKEAYTTSMAKAMKRYTPLPVRSAAIMENAGMLGEIRRATVMFVSIESDFLRKGTIYQRLERLQRIFEILQDNVITYRGIVKEFSVDDKGLVLVSGFGIPPHVGLTPPTRACLCSIALLKELHMFKVEAYIGITTGSVYAGSVGSKTRREFAMVGDTVNLAARLMVAAKKPIKKLREMSPEYRSMKLKAASGEFIKVQEQAEEDARKVKAAAPAVEKPSKAPPQRLKSALHKKSSSSNPFRTLVRQFSPPISSSPAPPKKKKEKMTKGFAKKVQDMMKKTIETLSATQSSILNHRTSSDANKLNRSEFMKKTKSGRLRWSGGDSLDDDSDERTGEDRHDSLSSDEFLGGSNSAGGSVKSRKNPGRINTSSSVENMIMSFVETVNDEEHIPQILVDGHTAAEVKSATKLFFHSLPEIQVKGKNDPVEINLIFSLDLDDSVSSPADLRAKMLAAPRYKSITDLMSSEPEGHSPILARGESSPDSPGKKTLSLSYIYQDTFLSFSQFRMVLPMVLGGTSVDLPLEDLCWIRSNGIPLYARTLSDELEAADRLFVDEDGNLSFGEMDLSFMLEIASAVPSKVQRSISSLVARLDSTMQIILKVICVSGGNSPFDLLLLLLENVEPFCIFWNSLCKNELSYYERGVKEGGQDESRSTEGGVAEGLEDEDDTDTKRAFLRKQMSAPLASKRLSYELGFAQKKDPKMRARDSSLNHFKRRSVVAEIPPLQKKPVEVEKGKDEEEQETKEGAGEPDIRSVGKDILRRTLKLLEINHFLEYDGGAVHLTDMFMVDTVCSTIPFKHRIALHEYIAQWHKEQTMDDIGERMKRFPIIVHHYVMANKEERASAELMMLNLFGGDFIDKWVLEQVKPMLPTMMETEKYDANEEDMLARSILALPSIPWLRGLAKAIRGQQVGSVLLKIAARFRTFFESFRKRKREGSLRRAFHAVTSTNFMRKSSSSSKSFVESGGDDGGDDGSGKARESSMGKISVSKEDADKRTEEIKAAKRESRTNQIRQMRRSSSSILVDASMKAKLDSLGISEKEETGSVTPTRVLFSKNQQNPEMMRSASEE